LDALANEVDSWSTEKLAEARARVKTLGDRIAAWSAARETVTVTVFVDPVHHFVVSLRSRQSGFGSYHRSRPQAERGKKLIGFEAPSRLKCR
jgi:hypothetical protein